MLLVALERLERLSSSLKRLAVLLMYIRSNVWIKLLLHSN